VTVDPDRIQEVLNNLLENALRYTPAGGTTVVDAWPNPDNRQPAAVIEVRDSGAGFLAQDSERIFDRFVKAPASPGSGLGLAIARAIVEAHHGTLTAHSDGPGKGARFTMTLPIGEAHPGRRTGSAG
jgi:signal transduction histidine kinase